uniref:Uncharacterized protein n=1 Tax=Anguilla anguilla TaxID=7936 RepID=A0A0E9QBN8_ANGAN
MRCLHHPLLMRTFLCLSCAIKYVPAKRK